MRRASFPGFTKFCCHNAVKFIVLREVIHKRQDHIAEEDQPLAGACDVLEELETELTGDPIEIAFNAKYITDVIRNITDEKLCMRFNSNVSPCVIAPQEGEDYLYLILPVRVFT